MVIYIWSDAWGFSYRKWQLVIEAQGSCLGSFVPDPAVPWHLSGVDLSLCNPGIACPPPQDHQQGSLRELCCRQMKTLFN